MNYERPAFDRIGPEAILRAEERRRRLPYLAIPSGRPAGERSRRTLELHHQAHQNYVLGYSDAVQALCGTLLEQCMVGLLEEVFDRDGRITIKDRGEIKEVTFRAGVVNLNLMLMINTAGYYRILPQELYATAVVLRLARNFFMHDRLPFFRESGEDWTVGLGRRNTDGSFEHNITLEKSEIDSHCISTDSQEIWAYYLLTRTRRVIEALYRDKPWRVMTYDTPLPAGHEINGNVADPNETKPDYTNYEYIPPDDRAERLE